MRPLVPPACCERKGGACCVQAPIPSTMFNLVVWAQSRNWTSRVLDRQSTPPRHFYGLPAVIPFLLAIFVVLLLVWFWMDPVSFWEFFGRTFYGIRASALSRISADYLRGVLSVHETKAAFDALAASMGEQIITQHLPLVLVRTVTGDSSDAEDEGDERLQVATVRIDEYPAVAKLEARSARVVDAKAMLRLRKMVCRLPEAACAEKLKDIIQADAPRFSNVIQDSWVLHKYPEGFANPCELTKESTKNWVCKLKVTTRLLCLMRCQLNEQDWLCQRLKDDYFAEVAGPYIRTLLEAASAFSSASWKTGDVSNMVPIFEAFLDSLCIIKQSFSRPDLLHVNDADIFGEVVNAFKVIIEGSENDLRRSEECALISATYYLIVALEFFHRNRNVQPILASAESGYTINLCDCWISKVKEDAERLFPNEEDRQYIFILNNLYFVWERKCQGEGFLSIETLWDWFNTLIDKYIGMYVDEYWVPLQKYIEGDYLINPCHSYLFTFTQEFDSNCNRQMKLKVLQAELRNTLREKIMILLVGSYDNFLASLVKARAVGPSSESSDKKQKGGFKKILRTMSNRKVDISSNNSSTGIVYTVQALSDVIKNLFEG